MCYTYTFIYIFFFILFNFLRIFLYRVVYIEIHVIILNTLFLKLKSMIQTQTILKVADNSGAKTVKCIGFQGTKKNATIGDCIIVSVRSLARRASVKINKSTKGGSLKLSSSKSAIQKGQIFKALIIRTKKGISNRKHGHHLSFGSNDVILLNHQDNLVASRIFGPITRELRAKDYRNVLSNSDRIL